MVCHILRMLPTLLNNSTTHQSTSKQILPRIVFDISLKILETTAIINQIGQPTISKDRIMDEYRMRLLSDHAQSVVKEIHRKTRTMVSIKILTDNVRTRQVSRAINSHTQITTRVGMKVAMPPTIGMSSPVTTTSRDVQLNNLNRPDHNKAKIALPQICTLPNTVHNNPYIKQCTINNIDTLVNIRTHKHILVNGILMLST